MQYTVRQTLGEVSPTEGSLLRLGGSGGGGAWGEDEEEDKEAAEGKLMLLRGSAKVEPTSVISPLLIDV